MLVVLREACTEGRTERDEARRRMDRQSDRQTDKQRQADNGACWWDRNAHEAYGKAAGG